MEVQNLSYKLQSSSEPKSEHFQVTEFKINRSHRRLMCREAADQVSAWSNGGRLPDRRLITAAQKSPKNLHTLSHLLLHQCLFSLSPQFHSLFHLSSTLMNEEYKGMKMKLLTTLFFHLPSLSNVVARANQVIIWLIYVGPNTMGLLHIGET